MTSKGQHVQDNSVVERRLRPIYDWLDNGNNKKALQECDKVLKKTPTLHCAKALKAVTLHRLGKESEAMALLDSLCKENPTDDATLQAMTLCYRELQQLDKICRIYETAVRIDPNNEETFTHLFMSYARIFDFKAQQQAAMALFRNKPKTPYYCWAVMSVVLQATRGEGRGDPKKRTLLLSLAERMMEKLILDGKLDAEQEVQLYIMILELQHKYEEIVIIFDGPLGEKLACSNPPQNRLKYLVPQKCWDEVNLLCKSILIESVDRWDIWKEYVNSVFELMTSPVENCNNHDNHVGGSEADTVDDSPEKCHEFICRIVENGADNGFLLRGPYLARFELCRHLLSRNMDLGDVLGDTVELFIEYFHKFGHKPCCVADLRIFLNLLDEDKKSELSTRLLKDVGISATSVPQSEQQMQRHLCALQLSRLCGSHKYLSPAHLRALVTAFSLHYQHGYQNYGSNLLSTDLGPSDPYALLAVHILYDLFVMEQSSQPIITGLIILEDLLRNSPSNFHAKLLAVKLYHTIGGSLGAQNMYNNLDAKHLQLDSLGFIHCARLPTTGLYSSCLNWFDITLKFFSSNYKDSSDHITYAYKYGSFTKIDEFMDFREKMSNSLHYTTVAIDRLMLTLVECTNLDGLYNLDISPKDDNIDWQALRDNHDLSVYISWDPERIAGAPEESPQIQDFFEQNVCFLKLRTSMLWSLSAAVEVVRSADGVRSNHVERLMKVLKDWNQLRSDVIQHGYTPLRQNQVTLPLPSRLHGALCAPYVQVLGGCFKVLITLSLPGDRTEEVEEYTKAVEDDLSEMMAMLDERMRDANWEDLVFCRETMEVVVNAVEILSISSLVYLLCADLAKPPGQSKKGRKKVSESNAKSTMISGLGAVLRHNLEAMDAMVQSWSTFRATTDLVDRMEALNLNSDGFETVCENVTNSYVLAGKEIHRVLTNKHKMLSGNSGAS